MGVLGAVSFHRVCWEHGRWRLLPVYGLGKLSELVAAQVQPLQGRHVQHGGGEGREAVHAQVQVREVGQAAELRGQARRVRARGTVRAGALTAGLAHQGALGLCFVTRVPDTVKTNTNLRDLQISGELSPGQSVYSKTIIFQTHQVPGITEPAWQRPPHPASRKHVLCFLFTLESRSVWGNSHSK